MEKKYKIVIVGVLLIVVIIGGIGLFKAWQEKRLIEATKARTEAEMKLIQLKKEYYQRGVVIDSMKTELNKTLAVIEYQKKYPQVIIKNYVAKKDSINNLSPSESFKLFTANLEYYKANRKRYDMANQQ